MADETATPAGAKHEVAKLYDEKLAQPLKQLIADTDKLLPLLAGEKDAVNKAAQPLIDARKEQEAFVARDAVGSLASLARNSKALEGFFKAVKGEKDGKLSLLEKNAATHRYETFDQFAETAAVVAQAASASQNAELVATAQAVAQTAAQVREGLSGPLEESRNKDTLFYRTLRELKSGETTQAHAAITAESSVKDIVEQRLAHPMHSIAKATAQLQEKLAALSDADKTALQHLTGAYREQCTLPDMHLAHDNNIPASLGALTDNAAGLRSLLTKVASGHKTEELTAQETAAANAGAWATTNDLRMPVRALAAMLNASNTTESGEAFKAANAGEHGKFDSIIKLAGKISSKSWEMQKAITAPGVEDKLKAAIAEYRAKPVEVPSPVLTGATATEQTPQQGQSRGAA